MSQELPLRIILETPPPGVDFAIQKGSGSKYETIQKQRSTNKDLQFDFMITVRNDKVSSPNFLGAFVQGKPNDRFIYIDIGIYAGQTNSVWSRRLKIPLRNITADMIKLVLEHPKNILEAKIPGTGKDNGPTCGTIKPFKGWYLIRHNN